MDIGKIVVAFAAILILATPVMAASQNSGDAGLICQSNGYQYSIATWNFNGEKYMLDTGAYGIFGGERSGYHTTVIGSAANAAWESNRNVNGVVALGTGNIQYTAASDLMSGSASTDGAITKVILCGNSGGRADPVVSANVDSQLNDQLEVPEFGFLALLGAVLVGIGLIAFRNSY